MIREKINENVVGKDTSVHPFCKGIYQNKGITLVSLIITIIILLIISGVAINGVDVSTNVAPYNNMIADIKLLEDKLSVYYNKYGAIPTIVNSNQTIDGVVYYKIDGVVYYKIDLIKLENITLNYGTEEDGDVADIYLVNDNLEVYYLKGIEKSETIHHTRVD